MAYLLNLVYLLLLAAASPWLLYQAVRHGKYRDGWGAKFWGRVARRQSRGPCIWFHAVSVGEVNLLAPLLERWERLHPDWECVISTTTQTGYALATQRYAPRRVIYCPLDFTWAVKRALRRIRPDLLVLTELELWPNLISLARERGIRVAVVNGRLSEKSAIGYGRLRSFIAPVLQQIDVIAVQSQTYAERFLALGAHPEQIVVTGSVKFDGVRSDRQNPATQRLAALAGIGADDIVLLAGSTQAPEEAIALQVFLQLADEHPRLKLIIVPRHPERFAEVARHLDQEMTRRRLPWQQRSKLAAADAAANCEPAPRVLLVDAVGELGSWWGTATIAFVGGSLGQRGGQNMIEPAAYGAAISFGPNTWNFRDVVQLLLERDAAVIVRDARELAAFVTRCLNEPQWAAQLGARGQKLTLEQQGASERTIALLGGLTRGAPSPHLPLKSKSQPSSAPQRRTA